MNDESESKFEGVTSENLSSDHDNEPKYALKTFEKDEFKALGFREYSLLKRIESNPHIVKVYSHSRHGVITSEKLQAS